MQWLNAVAQDFFLKDMLQVLIWSSRTFAGNTRFIAPVPDSHPWSLGPKTRDQRPSQTKNKKGVRRTHNKGAGTKRWGLPFSSCISWSGVNRSKRTGEVAPSKRIQLTSESSGWSSTKDPGPAAGSAAAGSDCSWTSTEDPRPAAGAAGAAASSRVPSAGPSTVLKALQASAPFFMRSPPLTPAEANLAISFCMKA